MAQRDTNIALNMTDDGTPAVHQQGTDVSTATTDDTDETDPRVTNPDGSVTVYGTPPDDAGDTTTENVPQSPLAGEIAAFEQAMDHPEDWTEAERRAVGMQRLHPALSDSEISDRLDISTTVVGQARQKVELATLDGREAIHTAWQDRTPTQQTVLAASVHDPDRSTTDLAKLADCARGTVGSIRRRFKPLLRQLSDVGLPEESDPPTEAATDETATTVTTASGSDSDRDSEAVPAQDDKTDAAQAAEGAFTCATCGATFDSHHARNGHTAVHTSEEDDASETDDETPTNESDNTSAADGTRPSIDDIKRFVTGLRERASDDHPQRHSEAQNGANGSAVQQVTCDAILTYIDMASTPTGA
jgi:DNA-directed RNA polymerase specialized sigma24 family protein